MYLSGAEVNGGTVEMSCMMSKLFLLVHGCWIYIIYEEMTQTRCLQICVFYCLFCVFVYKLHNKLLS